MDSQGPSVIGEAVQQADWERWKKQYLQAEVQVRVQVQVQVKVKLLRAGVIE